MMPLSLIPLDITKGAEKLLVTDPHGWILCLVSVSVVFSCLLILCGIYTLSGAIFSGKLKFRFPGKSRRGDEEAAVAAALAVALETGGNADDAEAAIAAALAMELSGSGHDAESYVITIKDRRPSGWSSKNFNFRKKPKRI